MAWARLICADQASDLHLAFDRMGLPSPAREYLLEKVPHLHVLLTGLSGEELRRLKEISGSPGEGVWRPFPECVAGDRSRRPGAVLLSGRRDQLERLVATLEPRDDLKALAAAIGPLLETLAIGERSWKVGQARFILGDRTYLMGVINVTPDSFSDGGKFFDRQSGIDHGLRLVEEGADFLDVGGESSRPGAESIGEDEEASRVLPVIEGLVGKVGVPISVDTTKASVARRAIEAGASVVNDISGGRADPAMLQVIAERQVSCCLMHIQGVPKTMQASPGYEDLIEEVGSFLQSAVERAVGLGIAKDRIAIDPGIGFGKTLGHNLFLLRRLHELRALGQPILVGTSRKSFIGTLSGGKPAPERLAGSLGSFAAIGVLGGADVLRVHDVGAAKEALAVADAIRRATDGGALARPMVTP